MKQLKKVKLMKEERKKPRFLLLRNIIWAIVIFILCAMPSESIPDPHLNIPHVDKVVHFGMFFILALLVCNELEYQTRLSLRKIYITAVCIAFVYGGIIELLQQYCFNRSGDVADLLADVVGAIAGCLIYTQLKRWYRKLKARG